MELSIHMRAGSSTGILLLLQSGFIVKSRTGISVKEFICGQTGLGYDYVLERVRTVLLDGKPVDDLEKAMVRDGSHLTLSAAMPGLVGITLGRGSLFASFRESITYKETGETGKGGEGFVQVKLFNLMMKELGTLFLSKGIFINRSLLHDCVRTQEVDFLKDCVSLSIMGEPADFTRLKDILAEGDEWVQFTVTA